MEKVKRPREETIQAWLIAELMRMLKVEAADVNIHDSFASYGLVSVDAVSLATALADWLGIEVSDTLLYDHPNIAALAHYLSGPVQGGSSDASSTTSLDVPERVFSETSNEHEPIAIIGMGCRFPGEADTPERFWQLLRDGRCTVSEVPAERWNIDAFYDPDPQTPGKMYTRFGSFVSNLDSFDAKFFGLSPREAMRMDPQQRLLLLVAWEALERAGIALETIEGSLTGVFIGMMSGQEYMYLQSRYGDGSHIDDPYFGLGGAASIAAGRLSYLLNLKGPALTVDTACSSSLVAIHLACQSLRSNESNLALVGGVNAILLPENVVNYCKMGMLSEKGLCRTFDAGADGFVLGEGCGMVVLKRLSDAQANGDFILAVIRGSAVNQDGRSNGLTAPNRFAQEAVIRQALTNAGVAPSEVQYVEAHGSGTALGDPIEVNALMAVMAEGRAPEQPLLLGAVKTNIGHLAGAAGIAGLIKTVLALHHREIPAHLHVQSPNPHIDWQRYPIEVVGQLRAWPSIEERLRIAGVSSFGWSGTNAHVILEEAPAVLSVPSARSEHALLLSAKTETALEEATERFITYLRANPDVALADIAYTTQVGRTNFSRRRAVVGQNVQQIIQALEDRTFIAGARVVEKRPVAFLFPGLGEQIQGVFSELYQVEPAFRQTIDECCAYVSDAFNLDLSAWQARMAQEAVTPATSGGKDLDLSALLRRSRAKEVQGSAEPPLQTALAQPMLFILEYALAQLLRSWGIVPAAMLGYSLGEYVAACLAGVFSLENALKLVVLRARLIQGAPQGGMLAVALAPAAVQPYLNDEVNLAAINAPQTCVLAGPVEALERLRVELEAQGIISRRVETIHAFHSAMLTPLRDVLTALARSVTLHKPHTPYISNVTGAWITPEQATSPSYWAEHMCQTVQFASGVKCLLNEREFCVLEVGPGQALSSFVKQHPACVGDYQTLVWPLLPAAHERRTTQQALLTNLAKLWLAGAPVNWRVFQAREQRSIVSLPTYPFEEQRYWPEQARPQLPAQQSSLPAQTQQRKADSAGWFYLPVWEPVEWPPVAFPALALDGAQHTPWLLFLDQIGLGDALARRLEQEGLIVVRVNAGEKFEQRDEQTFSLRADCREDYEQLCDLLRERNLLPETILHCGSFMRKNGTALDVKRFRASQEQGFSSLLFLIQALQAHGHSAPLRVKILSNHLQRVLEQDSVRPEHALLLAACKVIPQEYAQVSCDHIDLALSDEQNWIEAQEIEHLLAECCYQGSEHLIAYREQKRWLQRYRPVRLEAGNSATPLRAHGVYLITGGLGEIGLALAGYLARTVQARLVLLGRSALPHRDSWEAYLADPQAEKGTQEKLRRLLEMEALGAEVLTVQADVAVQEQVSAAIEQTIARFGELHGVFHAAGNLDQATFKLVQKSSPEDYEAHFAAKVYGTLALFQALQGLSLDFCLLFSSISAVLGGLGFVGYAAGNSFLDSFAQWAHRERSEQRWISVNWDTWLTSGIRTAFAGKGMLAYSMTFEEGLECLIRVLASSSAPTIVQSTGNLQERLQQWTHLASTATSQKTFGKSQEPQAIQTTLLPPSGEYERAIAAVWKEALGVKEVGLNDNFFELGGNSLIGIQVIRQINKTLNLQLSNVVLFEAPTVRALAHLARPAAALFQRPQVQQERMETRKTTGQQDIALIGMAGRFPGASNIEQFWQNLRNGVESISFFTKEELAEVGVPEHVLKNPNYVRARPILEDVETFDAAFFGYTPRDADLLDPQHRLFLECCWEAMEMAGYDTQAYKGLVGVFGGSAMSTYLLSHASSILGSIDEYQLVISNDKDSLTTTVSYKLNLKGPSIAVQTFCSTSLVAVHLAAQSLLNGECDMAMAGGVSVRVPSKNGYLYQEGGMESIDGHCRTFDAAASGSLFGDGVGVVVLKRLDDALADGDAIHTVIRGTAINNDGSLKVSYSAPSVVGQTEAIKAALASAGVPAESISYVEAHGTATELGDPIEVTALTKAFRSQTERRQFCAIGSVKTNIGHLDRAAGVSGLIKTALALEHEELPATLHYLSPNPEIDFASSPFYVNASLTPWIRNGSPRRAMVNSLGMGGTNAHVILEEAPSRPPSDPSRTQQIFVLSARTASALERVTENLRAYLQHHSEANLADVAYTLQVGRRRFEHRSMLISGSREETLNALASGRQISAREQRNERPLALLFPSEDVQWERVARVFYTSEADFRAIFDQGSEILLRQTGLDLRQLLDLDALHLSSVPEKMAAQSALPAQVALFLSQYALGHLLIALGLTPQALVGYGLGVYVAAGLAGVLTLEEALLLALEQTRNARSGDQEASVERAWRLTLRVPQIPVLSPLTGDWLRPEEAVDPLCWQCLAEQSTPTLKGLEQLLREPDYILLTAGGEQIAELSALMTQRSSGDLTTLPLALTALPPGQDEGTALLTTLGQLWLAGYAIDWENFYSQERRYRIPLPTYPFEKQRYWIETSAQIPGAPRTADVAQKKPLKDWFYFPGWKQTPSVHTNRREDYQDHWVFFLDECQLGKQLITRLGLQSSQITLVSPGTAFQVHGASTYTIHPERLVDYEALFRDLQMQGKTPTHLVHLWLVTPPSTAEVTDSQAQEILGQGFYSLLLLAQALGNQEISSCELNVLSTGIHAVTGDEQICPEKAPVLGPCRVITQEYAGIRCRNIDIVLPKPGSQHEADLLRLLSSELGVRVQESVVALRGSSRWIQTFEAMELVNEQSKAVQLRQGGVYLITGGQGGIGLIMASYLARVAQARLVLIGRSELPPRHEWPRILKEQGDTSGLGWRIRVLQNLEQQGTEMLIVKADVTDEGQMRHAIEQSFARFGAIHGILHTAGLPGVGLIQVKKPASAAQVLAPKIVGTRLLTRLIREHSQLTLDFLALFSSITSITGGPGQVDYCAANAYLDACAHRRYDGINAIISVDWSEWQWNAWEAGLAGYDIESQQFFRTQREIFGISAEEGTEALMRILSTSVSHVIVSPQPFQALLDLSATLTASTVLQRTREQQQSRAKHPRPNLGSTYVPPGNSLERLIASIWEDLLGIDGVGVNDNFFELGGNSLIGLDLVARLKKAFQIETLAAYVIYESPSIGALAQAIAREGESQNSPVGSADRGARRRDALKRRMSGSARGSQA